MLNIPLTVGGSRVSAYGATPPPAAWRGGAQSTSVAFCAENASKSEYRQGRSSSTRRSRSNISRSAVESDEAQPALAEGAFHRAERAAAAETGLADCCISQEI